VPDHANGQVFPSNLVFRTHDGSVVLPCDDGAVIGTKLYISSDNCKTWEESEGRIEGIHAGVTQLKDGSLLALGRRRGGDPRRMPQSISADMGATWEVTESPFDPVSGGQRPVLMRLQEGPLLFCSFAKTMSVTDISGEERTASGLFGALSYDGGVTWPVRRLISDDEPGRWVDGGAWTGNFFMSYTFGEPRGYLAATQAANGLIHLVSSRNHYTFNLKWLETPPPKVDGESLL
jgi:sulfatase modifying factor 1